MRAKQWLKAQPLPYVTVRGRSCNSEHCAGLYFPNMAVGILHALTFKHKQTQTVKRKPEPQNAQTQTVIHKPVPPNAQTQTVKPKPVQRTQLIPTLDQAMAQAQAQSQAVAAPACVSVCGSVWLCGWVSG